MDQACAHNPVQRSREYSWNGHWIATSRSSRTPFNTTAEMCSTRGRVGQTHEMGILISVITGMQPIDIGWSRSLGCCS